MKRIPCPASPSICGVQRCGWPNAPQSSRDTSSAIKNKKFARSGFSSAAKSSRSDGLTVSRRAVMLQDAFRKARLRMARISDPFPSGPCRWMVCQRILGATAQIRK